MPASPGLLYAALIAVLLPALCAAAGEAPGGSEAGGAVLITFVQIIFLMVPASVVLQVYAVYRLDGNRKRLARRSAYAMGALWLFVILTGLAGSNLSPIWLVILSPFFVLFLGTLLFRDRRSVADVTLAGSRR